MISTVLLTYLPTLVLMLSLGTTLGFLQNVTYFDASKIKSHLQLSDLLLIGFRA